MGAIGSFMDRPPERDLFRFIYSVTDKTITETVLAFLQKLIDDLPVPVDMITVYLDNHPVHTSGAVRQFAYDKRLDLQLLPKYSPALNPIEHLWHMVKAEWAKRLAATHHELDPANLERNITFVCELVRARLTPKIMHGSDKHYQLCLHNILV